ncbi:neutral/alkaline non-lysosomal ceramidase N-terminal domain-containing protein [Draconibacterium sp.]|nr:neutral/alkaline non-lysosomal ceramidase N-terminal domain-containing protein [Draconibacterium sp.]
MKKIFRILLIGFATLVVAGILLIKYQTHDRHPDYQLDLKINSSNEGQIKAGFAAVSITPEIVDTWNDKDGNARYEPKKGDTFKDNNNNGKFDAYWIAGFHNRRAANGIHDPLWARTMVIDDGQTRIAMVALDAIGLFHDQVIEIREKLSEKLEVDYCMVASTHVHEAPDLMGIWGESYFKSGVNKEYLKFIISQTVNSVEAAVKDLEPVSLHFAKDEKSTLPLVKDTRKPIVHDPGMYILQAKKADGSTKGTLISWANHPETLWSKNLLLTSDFPHYFRAGVENKVGGICVYFNGAIGGLITTHPSLAVKHPKTGKEISEATFEKAEAQGMILANIAINAIDNSTDSIAMGAINLQAKTFVLPFKNPMFRLASVVGVLDRGTTGRWQVRTEMAAIKIGPASFLTIPGEIYPEIVNGGIIAPEGRDFEIDPTEIPPLRSKMPGKYKFVIGLANDELGYIIPKSEWDNKEPWLFYSESDFYGEENSAGPETAPIIHNVAMELLNNMN